MGRVILVAALVGVAFGGTCPDDDSDLCDEELPSSAAVRMSPGGPAALSLVLAGAGHKYAAAAVWLAALGASVPRAAGAGATDTMPTAGTCGAMKAVYNQAGCCGQPAKSAGFKVVPSPTSSLFKDLENPCHGKKPLHSGLPNAGNDKYFENQDCDTAGVLEQAGANVTKGYQGEFDTQGRQPILTDYFAAGLCPVNVHWHLGTEHFSAGEYDDQGTGPDHGDVDDEDGEGTSRRLGAARLGFRCNKYDENDAKFTTPYKWQHCKDMIVGETYEVHWPHSAAGMCGTPHQYQTPFYDGVFCVGGIVSLDPVNVNEKVGVQAQIFTIVNDEDYYYPDLFKGWIKQGDEWASDVAYYTGSTTGTSRNNEVCSKFTPITWQVDRKCHLISASSFDKMCADMKMQHDDMTSDLHAHGSRELVADEKAANNQQRRQ